MSWDENLGQSFSSVSCNHYTGNSAYVSDSYVFWLAQKPARIRHFDFFWFALAKRWGEQSNKEPFLAGDLNQEMWFKAGQIFVPLGARNSWQNRCSVLELFRMTECSAWQNPLEESIRDMSIAPPPQLIVWIEYALVSTTYRGRRIHGASLTEIGQSHPLSYFLDPIWFYPIVSKGMAGHRTKSKLVYVYSMQSETA